MRRIGEYTLLLEVEASLDLLVVFVGCSTFLRIGVL
jgi:hypothetical protein